MTFEQAQEVIKALHALEFQLAILGGCVTFLLGWIAAKVTNR